MIYVFFLLASFISVDSNQYSVCYIDSDDYGETILTFLDGGCYESANGAKCYDLRIFDPPRCTGDILISPN